MDRMIGWVVKAKGEKGKLKIVSGPLQTRSGAETYREMYAKQHPEAEPVVEQRVLEDRELTKNEVK